MRHFLFTASNKVLFSLLLLSHELFARAGGGYSSGGRYSSSSYSSYSSGSSSGDGTVTLWAVGIIVIWVVLALIENAHRERRSSTIVKAFKLKSRGEYDYELRQLQKRDPNFDLDLFETRMQQPFKAIQYAWSNEDMSPARGYISDGIYERFTAQLAMQKSCGRHNIMRNVKVLDTRTMGIGCSEHFDIIHLAIKASALDYTVLNEPGMRPIDSEQKAKNAATPSTFVEVWSFIRKPSAKTLFKPRLIEGRFPTVHVR
jgi:hypothetical protein